MGLDDSFDFWAASLCWGDEDFPPCQHLTGAAPTRDAASSPSGPLDSSVAVPQSELQTADKGVRGTPAGQDDAAKGRAGSSNVQAKRADFPCMLSTQDILEHEASVDCGAAWHWPLREEDEELPASHDVDRQNDPTLRYEAPTLPYEIQWCAQDCTQDDATQLYEAKRLTEATEPNLASSSTCAGATSARGDAPETLPYGVSGFEARPEVIPKPSAMDVATLEYEACSNSAGHLSAETFFAAASSPPVATPARQGVHRRLLRQDLRQPEQHSGVAEEKEVRATHVTPEKVASQRGSCKARIVPGQPSCTAMAPLAEASQWLVPVKRRRLEKAETVEAHVATVGDKSGRAGMTSVRSGMLLVTEKQRGNSQSSQGSTASRRQLTLAEAWRGAQHPMPCQDVLEIL